MLGKPSVAIGPRRVPCSNFGLFLDLLVSNNQIVAGVICRNLVRIVRNLYLGFQGDLVFFDNEGATDPVFSGLGTRYSLIYLEVTDLAAGEG
jgi:hypothetical protein